MNNDQGSATARRVPGLHLVLLAVLTAAGLFVRWQSAECGLPHLRNADEQIYLEQYEGYASGEAHPEARARFSTYPSLWARIVSMVPRGPAPEGIDELAMERARASRDALFLRRCVAVCASLAIPLTWLLALRFVSSAWALGAAALVATSILHTGLSIQARPHALATTAIVAALATAVAHVQRGTWRSALSAGLAAGLAMAIFQNGVAALLPLAAAVGLRCRGGPRRALLHGAVAALAVLVLFLAAYPGVWRDDGVIAGRNTGHSRFLANLDLGLRQFTGGGHRAVWSAFADHDPLLLAGAVVAAAVAVRAMLAAGRAGGPRARPSESTLVVLSFAIPYFVVLVLFSATFVRFALPLVPVLALFTVVGLARTPRFGVACLVVILLGQTWTHLWFAALLRRPDTCELAADWIRESVDRGRARISVSPILELPLARTTAALGDEALAPVQNREKWIRHQERMSDAARERLGYDIRDLPLRRSAQRDALLADPEAWVAGLHADFVVLDVHTDEIRILLQAVRSAVRERGTLVADFAPQGASARNRHGLDPYLSPGFVGDEHFVWRLASAEALGPWIEIYRMDRGR